MANTSIPGQNVGMTKKAKQNGGIGIVIWRHFLLLKDFIFCFLFWSKVRKKINKAFRQKVFRNCFIKKLQ